MARTIVYSLWTIELLKENGYTWFSAVFERETDFVILSLSWWGELDPWGKFFFQTGFQILSLQSGPKLTRDANKKTKKKTVSDSAAFLHVYQFPLMGQIMIFLFLHENTWTCKITCIPYVGGVYQRMVSLYVQHYAQADILDAYTYTSYCTHEHTSLAGWKMIMHSDKVPIQRTAFFFLILLLLTTLGTIFRLFYCPSRHETRDK